MRTPIIDTESSFLVPTKSSMEEYYHADHFYSPQKKTKLKQEEETDFDWQRFLSDEVYVDTKTTEEQKNTDDWYHTNTDLTELDLTIFEEQAQITTNIIQEISAPKGQECFIAPATLQDKRETELYLTNLKTEEFEVPHFSRGSSPCSYPPSSTVPPSRDASPSLQNRKRKIKEEHVEEEEVEVKKEKNRVAAQRYRQKLREEALRVNEQVGFFEAQNELIKNQIEAFRRQIEQDRKIILHLQLIMSLQNQNALMENKQ